MKVTCGKDIIERAKREKRFIITIAVNGKPIGDDSMCIQRVADLKLAQKVAKYAIALMKSGAERGEGR